MFSKLKLAIKNIRLPGHANVMDTLNNFLESTLDESIRTSLIKNKHTDTNNKSKVSAYYFNTSFNLIDINLFSYSSFIYTLVFERNVFIFSLLDTNTYVKLTLPDSIVKVKSLRHRDSYIILASSSSTLFLSFIQLNENKRLKHIKTDAILYFKKDNDFGLCSNDDQVLVYVNFSDSIFTYCFLSVRDLMDTNIIRFNFKTIHAKFGSDIQVLLKNELMLIYDCANSLVFEVSEHSNNLASYKLPSIPHIGSFWIHFDSKSSSCYKVFFNSCNIYFQKLHNGDSETQLVKLDALHLTNKACVSICDDLLCLTDGHKRLLFYKESPNTYSLFKSTSFCKKIIEFSKFGRFFTLVASNLEGKIFFEVLAPFFDDILDQEAELYMNAQFECYKKHLEKFCSEST